MQKTKCYLAALVSGVLLVTGILAGYGQSKKKRSPYRVSVGKIV